MVVRIVVAVIVTMVALIGLARGLKAADWALMRMLPGQEWAQRGPVLDQHAACLTALASDGIVVPAGTRLKCERAIIAREAAR